MSRKYIIDGYNLIYQIPELRRDLEYDLETARDGLILRLDEFAVRTKVQVVLVFDGDKRISDPIQQKNKLKVVYSKFPEKADPLIKKMIDTEKDKNQLIVVSSDHEIMNYARLSYVKAVSAQTFTSEMSDKTYREIQKKFNKSMDVEELDEWMQIFQKGKQNSEPS